MKSNANIATILKEYRGRTGLTGKQVVTILKKYGISISEKTLLGYESGVGTPRVNTFLALCKIYKISDIMEEFGYSTPLKLATGDNEWETDLYNDFFNATLLEKIFILLRNGIPSFDGYEEQLQNSLPSDATAANLNRLYTLFSSLDESQQSIVFHFLEDIKKHNAYFPSEYMTSEEREIIQLYRFISDDGDRTAIHSLLNKYKKVSSLANEQILSQKKPESPVSSSNASAGG